MRLNKIVPHIVHITFLFLLALSINFEFALNIFNFLTVVILILSLLTILFRQETTIERSSIGKILIISYRFVLIVVCAGMGMFWQAIFWTMIAIIITGVRNAQKG